MSVTKQLVSPRESAGLGLSLDKRSEFVQVFGRGIIQKEFDNRVPKTSRNKNSVRRVVESFINIGDKKVVKVVYV